MSTPKTWKSTLCLSLGLCLLGGQALAQESDSTSDIEEVSESSETSSPKVRMGVFLGGNYLSPENELGNSFHDDQVPGSGFMLGARASYLVLDSILPDTSYNPQLRLELEGKFTFSSTEGNSQRKSTSSDVLGWRANAVIDFFPDKKLVPFALIGMGGETVFGSSLFLTSPDTDFATYFGGGVHYAVADKLDLRGDLRLGSTASREDALSSLFEIQLGVTYSFGASQTKTIVITKDTPPPPAKEEDSDRDGIPDADDACPQLAEVQNGIDDADGCPEVDSDHDGLLGSQDQCPAAAEDLDGTEDEDGCPDPDNDGDGRPDVIDQCPSQPENLNGFEDEDGCPDTIPVKVQQFTGKIAGIKFKTGSARILRKSRKTLDAAHKVFTDNPSIRFEVSGHTDNQGSADNNRALSRKRADYVKWYLVDKGISAERIVTIGHGPDKPLESNETRKGQKMNRRIEFRLLPGAATVAPAPGVGVGTKSSMTPPTETKPDEGAPKPAPKPIDEAKPAKEPKDASK